MAETASSSSSTSSCASISSFDGNSVKNISTVKFLCCYGGKILPRYSDGKLRYFGGHTRVLAVDPSIPFSELMVKLGELCGWETVSLRCQLPTEDLDALVSITSEEDLVNLLEEYDLANKDKLVPLKIRAFLYEVKPPSSPDSSNNVPPLPPPPQIPSGSQRWVYHHHRHPQLINHQHRRYHRHQEHRQENEIYKNYLVHH